MLVVVVAMLSVASVIEARGTLSMGANNPIILKDYNHGLVYGDGTYRDVGIDGPFLFGFSAGALGTTQDANELKLTWAREAVAIYKTLYMNSNNIEQVKGVYYNFGANTQAFTVGGQNYLDTYAPSVRGSNAGNLRFFSDGGNILLDSNIAINGTGSNYVTMASGGASIGIAVDNNLYFTGNGSGGTNRYANFQETNVSFNSGTAGSLSIYVNGHAVRNVGDLTRNLISNVISQPVIQYGVDSNGTGTSGSVTVTLPAAYTSSTSYVAFAVMQDSDAAKMSVTRTSASSITIYWSQGGSNAHIIAWNTMGT